MDKLEKVIKGLECCAIDGGCGACPYDSFKDCPGSHPTPETLMKDALALLKAHPRMMTLEEVKQHNNQDGCVWFEQPTYNAVAAFVLKDDDMTQVISPYILGEPINHGYWTNCNYGKTWRCWTSRPDQEIMEATPLE